MGSGECEVTGTYSCVGSGACEGTGAYQACDGCAVTGAYQACEACEASGVRVAVLFAILSVELVELVFFFEEWAVCEGTGAYAVRLVSRVRWACDSR